MPFQEDARAYSMAAWQGTRQGENIDSGNPSLDLWDKGRERRSWDTDLVLKSA